MALKILDIFKARATEKQMSPETAEILLRARSLQEEGQLVQAAAAYQLILETDPDHWESLNAIAAISLRGGEFERAIHLYSGVIERKHDHAEAYYKRANARNGLGRWEAALVDYDQAIAHNPKYANAFCNRGAVLERLARWDEALISYERALALNPEDFLAYYNRGSVLKELKRFDDALASYERAIALKVDYVEAYINRGNILRELRRYEAAVASYGRAIELAPGSFLLQLAYCGLGLALAELTRYDEAVASYGEAIKLDPADYLAYSNRGAALKKLRRLEEALANFEQTILLKSDYVEAHFYRGQVLQEMGRFEAALASHDKAIELTPEHLSPYLAHSSRGFALAGLKRFDEALAAFEQAIALKSDYFEAHCSRGHVLHELRRYEAAIASYDAAIALDPDDLRAHPAYSSRGFALKELKRFEDALASYDRAIALEDTDVEVRINRGGVLQEMGRHEAAIASYDRAIVLKPDHVEAYQGRGFSLLNRGRHEAAIASFDQAIALKADQKYLLGFRRYVQMQICDWDGLASYIEGLEQELRARNPVSAPFQVLALVDSPPLHRLAAEIWVREECPPDTTLGAIPQRPLTDKIRIGYFSADFRSHPVSLLTAELFETHDRSRFEIIAFALGPKVNDAVRERLERAFDRFIDVSEWSDLKVAETARRMGIDIAVDLGGFTEYARPKIFALRSAPIQISYIGYLGTMGAPYMDYLLADPTIIPANERQSYSEAIIYLPSYQVNDSKRPVVERALTREELGLPATGFVFSCFNANYKITPIAFAVWMRILLRVEGSSFFLYAGNEVAERNLRKEAERRGVDPHRMVFGRFLAQEDYLARFRSMDLFLDTLPYNAGTTASDALWAGLPVLTCAGQAFAGRVAASLLKAIDLPELVTSTAEQYEEMAVQLAENPELLRKIKQKLAQNRLKTALFDTRSFTKHLEVAYTKVQERQHESLAPQTIFVTPIA
ncbi:MAG TPA: tetratricopeptide repeat protein [Steroidobacteraceae bacterium]